MRRREFLRWLGLAPVALPLAASAISAQPGALLSAELIPGELITGISGTAELGGSAAASFLMVDCRFEGVGMVFSGTATNIPLEIYLPESGPAVGEFDADLQLLSECP